MGKCKENEDLERVKESYYREKKRKSKTMVIKSKNQVEQEF